MAAERRTVIVTGATSGLGLRCAGTIAAQGCDWTVLLAGRDPVRLAAAADRIEADTGRRCSIPEVDLVSLDSIRAALRAIFQGQGVADHPGEAGYDEEGFAAYDGIAGA